MVNESMREEERIYNGTKTKKQKVFSKWCWEK